MPVAKKLATEARPKLPVMPVLPVRAKPASPECGKKATTCLLLATSEAML